MSDDRYLRFFRLERHVSIPIVSAAALLGVHPLELRAIAETREETVPWEEVAYHLFTTRPRASLDGDHLPRDLRLVRVSWRLPRYVVRAMELQATRRVDDYIADVLHERIELSTVDALQNDREFMEAFLFP